MNAPLEERIQRLEDIEAIKKLTAEYGHAVDRGCNGSTIDGEKLASIFAEDATWKYAAQSVDAKGREEILAFLTVEGPISFAQHSFTNPVIDITGDTASATYLLWVAVNMGGAPAEVYQSEDLTYERTASGWVIKSIDLHFGQMVLGEFPQAQ